MPLYINTENVILATSNRAGGMSVRRNAQPSVKPAANVICYQNKVVNLPSALVGIPTPERRFNTPTEDVRQGILVDLTSPPPDGGANLVRRLLAQFDAADEGVTLDQTRLTQFQLEDVETREANHETWNGIVASPASLEPILTERNANIFQTLQRVYGEDVCISTDLQLFLQRASLDPEEDTVVLTPYQTITQLSENLSTNHNHFQNVVSKYRSECADIEACAASMLTHALSAFIAQERFYKCTLSNTLAQHHERLLARRGQPDDSQFLRTDVQEIRTNMQNITLFLNTNVFIATVLKQVTLNVNQVQRSRFLATAYLRWSLSDGYDRAPTDTEDFEAFQRKHPAIQSCWLGFCDIFNTETDRLETHKDNVDALMRNPPTTSAAVAALYENELKDFVGSETDTQLDTFGKRHEVFKQKYMESRENLQMLMREAMRTQTNDLITHYHTAETTLMAQLQSAYRPFVDRITGAD